MKDVSNLMKVKPSEMIKTLIYVADEEPVAVLIRGDHEANETKIKGHLKARTIELANENKVEEVTGSAMGFSGPAGLSIKILADIAIRGMFNAVTGANKTDTHLRNVNLGRDFEVNEWIDARVITENDPCPGCGGAIELKCAIEIGHTFKLGTKYSEILNATFLDDKGKEKPAIMGCYGIGVNRILAALIESNHDKDGIIWPSAVNPCEVIVIPVKKEDKELCDEAERVYTELKDAGIDVVIDDRERSAGVKFKDADLIGFPLQVIIGRKCLDKGKIEIKNRATKKSVLIGKDKIIEYTKEALASGT